MTINTIQLSHEIYEKIYGIPVDEPLRDTKIRIRENKKTHKKESKTSVLDTTVKVANDITNTVSSVSSLIQSICELTTGDILNALCAALSALSDDLFNIDSLLNKIGLSLSKLQSAKNLFNNKVELSWMKGFKNLLEDAIKILSDVDAIFIKCFSTNDENLTGASNSLQSALDALTNGDNDNTKSLLDKAIDSLTGFSNDLLKDLKDSLDVLSSLKRLCQNSLMNSSTDKSPLSSLSQQRLTAGIRILMK